MTTYRARMDAFVFWMTTSILALFAFLAFVMLTTAAARPASTALTVGLIAGTMFVAGIAVYGYAYAPQAFYFRDHELRIERPAGDVVIPLASITGATPLDAFLGLSLKAPPGGNSGLFGIYGTFYRRDIGKFQMYSRRAKRTVLLETTGGPVVVGPERRDEFIRRVREGLSV